MPSMELILLFAIDLYQFIAKVLISFSLKSKSLDSEKYPLKLVSLYPINLEVTIYLFLG